jgi:hypothetical protein
VPVAREAPPRLVLAAFAVLVAATVGAFFLAAKLKAEPGVVHDLSRDRYFSPNHDGRDDVEHLSFRLTRSDRLTVDVVDQEEGRVRRLVTGLDARRGRLVRLTWDGRQQDGTRAPDGVYRIRVILQQEGRSVVPPPAFHLDTRPPRPAATVTTPRVATEPIVAPGEPVGFAFRGLGRRQPAQVSIVRTDVTPPQAVRTFEVRATHRGTWDGRTDAGAPAPPGTYLVAITGQDEAGNVGTGPTLPPRPGLVRGRPGFVVRALAVQPPVRPVTAGDLVAFRVDARGRAYRWDVRRVGIAHPVKASRRPNRDTTIAFRAPAGDSGVYLLEVRSGRWLQQVPFAVQARRSAPMLVVLPTISWLGRTAIDDDRDGVPNTFAASSPVPFPRPFAGRGLPAGLVQDLGPLLVFLDRAHLRYDVTTDLALALSDADPAPGSHRGLLFAGAPEWVSRPLARRLRRFVDAGGRVALFGPDALRAGVTVGDGRLTRPTPPGPADAFGGRLAAVRRLTAEPGRPPVLTVVPKDDPALGLLDGFSGELGGFTSAEELISPGPRAQVDAGIGQALTDQEAAAAEAANQAPRPERAALSATAEGKGEVIRVGLPEWGARVQARDPVVAQLTRNIVDLLRGVRPRVRSTP